MARQRMITRTINVVKYEVICMDVTTVETTIQTFELTGENLPDSKALKMLQSAYETDTFKIVAITNKSVSEKMFGMLETDFIKLAMELNPETRKAYDF